MDAQDDRECRVDVGEGLEDARVPGLGEALAAVLLVHVEAQKAGLAQVAEELVGDPALVLELAVVLAARDLARRPDQAADLLLLVGVGHGPREDHVLVDLAEEERFGERRDSTLGLVLGFFLRGGFHVSDPTPQPHQR